MTKRLFASACAVLIIVTSVGSTTLLIAPRGAHAAGSFIGAVSCIKGLVLGTAEKAADIMLITANVISVPVNDRPVEVATAQILGGVETTAGTTMGNCVYDTILVPLAKLLARMVLQNITAATISWINGSNGSGQALYARNLPAQLRDVGDLQAAVFLGGISLLGSPFGTSIASALRINYLQQTSAAGFFAAYRSTLPQASPDINAFLNGNWSQGGVRAWFALTTQSQNNPYMLYQASQSQISTLVGAAQAATVAQLNWGQGFFSWCGPGSSSNSFGATPGCFKPDGSIAAVLTPGSVLHDYTQQAVVNSGISQLIAVNDLDSALGAIISALGKRILGAAGGLFGSSAGGTGSFTSQLQNYSGSTGTGPSGDDLSSRVSQYQTALDALAAAANQAQTGVATLATFATCPSATSLVSGFRIQIQVTLATVTHGQTILANANAVLEQTTANPYGGSVDAALTDVQPVSQDIAEVQALVGQMTGISTQVQNIKASCAVPPQPVQAP